MQETETADWPERFVYVCSATGFRHLNTAPLLQAGVERVAAVVILVGLTNENNPDTGDKKNAILPAEALKTLAIEELGLSPDQVEILRGNGDLFEVWHDRADQIIAFARQHADTILFNISGGRVPMKISTLLRLRQQTEIKAQYLSVGMNEFALRLLEYDADGRPHERTLPVHGGLPLAEYLKSFGLVEINASAREKTQKHYADLAGVVDMYRGMLPQRAFANAVRELLNCLPSEDRPIRLPYKFRVSAESWELLRPITARMPGVTAEEADRGLTLESHQALKFLRGHWLEALVYNRLRHAFSDRADVTIATTLDYMRHDETGRRTPKSESDFDVVLLCGNQMVLIECKAIVSISDRLRQGINMLGERRKELMGEGGRAYLIAPLLDLQQLKTDGLVDQATAGNVTLLAGSGALDTLLRDLRDFYRP